MSIPGDVPHYILAVKRDDGLIDWAVFNPRGWVHDSLVGASHVGARDEEQVIGRAAPFLRPDQKDVKIIYASRDEFEKQIANQGSWETKR